MSVIHFPRRSTPTTRGPKQVAPRPLRSQPPTRSTEVARERVARQRRRRPMSPMLLSGAILMTALAIAAFGMLENGSRQVELHNLQTSLLTEQSTYAAQVSAFSAMSAPSVVATHASSLHLVTPLSVSQISSTSLAVTLPLPKFVGYAPVIARTNR